MIEAPAIAVLFCNKHENLELNLDMVYGLRILTQMKKQRACSEATCTFQRYNPYMHTWQVDPPLVAKWEYVYLDPLIAQ